MAVKSKSLKRTEGRGDLILGPFLCLVFRSIDAPPFLPNHLCDHGRVFSNPGGDRNCAFGTMHNGRTPRTPHWQDHFLHREGRNHETAVSLGDLVRFKTASGQYSEGLVIHRIVEKRSNRPSSSSSAPIVVGHSASRPRSVSSPRPRLTKPIRRHCLASRRCWNPRSQGRQTTSCGQPSRGCQGRQATGEKTCPNALACAAPN